MKTLILGLLFGAVLGVAIALIPAPSKPENIYVNKYPKEVYEAVPKIIEALNARKNKDPK